MRSWPELEVSAADFQQTLRRAKSRLGTSFDWYPYDSLANFTHLRRLLDGRDLTLADLAGDGPILDIGCADGDTCFFLERLGFQVVALDHGRSNHNGLRGVRALREELGSSLILHDVDIDRQFALPATHGLAFALGVLYHLKNPLYFLETLSRHCRYCFLSTRVMRVLPDQAADLYGEPVAYLAGAAEVNGDDSNFWIFTETALRRLLTRTKWEPLAWMTLGCEKDSDPVRADRDQRVFCLLESRHALSHSRSSYGLHEPEQEGWRWTERRFGVTVPKVGDGGLDLRFYLPDNVLALSAQLSIACRIDGEPVAPQVYRSSGEHTFHAPLPSRTGKLVQLDFEVSHAMPGDETDPRERAIVVAQISC